MLSASPVSTDTARSYGFPGATPSISANGTNNGIVWTMQMGAPAVLVACNATNLTTELYNSSQAAGNRDRLATGTKFAVPTVADGKVFVGNSNSVSVFGLLAGTFSLQLTGLQRAGGKYQRDHHGQSRRRNERRGAGVVCDGRGRNGGDRRELHRRFRRVELDEWRIGSKNLHRSAFSTTVWPNPIRRSIWP